MTKLTEEEMLKALENCPWVKCSDCDKIKRELNKGSDNPEYTNQ